AAPGLYDLRGRGPSIGGQGIGLAEAESLVAASSRESGATTETAAAEKPVRFDEARTASAVAGLLDGEIRRLSELRLSMRGTQSLDKAEFRSRVLESDYLFWAFPDQDRARHLPQDFLNRLMVQVEFWTHRLESL